jgi:hypothetical protein
MAIETTSRIASPAFNNLRELITLLQWIGHATDPNERKGT